jgi:hypothetical protein
MQSGLWTVKVVLSDSVKAVKVWAASASEAAQAALALEPGLEAASLYSPGQVVSA